MPLSGAGSTKGVVRWQNAVLSSDNLAALDHALGCLLLALGVALAPWWWTASYGEPSPGGTRMKLLLEYWSGLRDAFISELTLTRRAGRACVNSLKPKHVALVPALLYWAALASLLTVVWQAARPHVFSHNLALKGSATAISNCGLTPPYAPERVEPSRLIDGKKNRAYDACTRRVENAWVLVDLKRAAMVDSMVVSGRDDCCWLSDTLPLVLEASMDRNSYEVIARRETPFTRDEPWRVELAEPVHARYVRVRIDREGPGEIVLSEIEIYGR